MNFSKNLLNNQMFYYLNNILFYRQPLSALAHRSPSFRTNPTAHRKWYTRKSLLKTSRFSSHDASYIIESNEEPRVYPYYLDSQPLSKSEELKSILLKDSNNPKVMEIAKCASVEEVFKFVNDNLDRLDYQCLTQIVLALHYLQYIFIYHYEEQVDNLTVQDNFFKKLLDHREFYLLTKAIENSLDSFQPPFLSQTFLYLSRLGIPEESQLIQNISLKLRDQLLNDFSLDIATNLIRVIFLEDSVRPYYIIIDLIPKIFEQIELIETTKEIDNLTTCLIRLQNILTDDILRRFETKVNVLIQKEVITEADYKQILKIICLFYLQMRGNKYSSLISKCILLMKNSMESLNIMEMHFIYDVFFKNQEPGEALNTIQRTIAKLLYEMENDEVTGTNKLKLFCSLSYFASPINKEQLRHDIEKYLNEENTLNNFIILRKTFTYLKVSDVKLCENYWNKGCQILKAEKDIQKIIKLTENYLYYCGDFIGFKHYAFEHHGLSVIQKHFHAGSLTIFPQSFFTALAFALISSYDTQLLEKLLQKFEELSTQLSPMDIFKLSYTMTLLKQRKSIVTPTQLAELRKILHTATARIYIYLNPSPEILGLLVKSLILRHSYHNQLADDMMTSFKDIKYMSSKILEYIVFNLYTSRMLIPEVINNCTKYIIEQKTNIMGFNAGKLLHMLYCLNYQPVYEDKFFDAATDVIIRDRERLSCLAYLQAALSLSFFNRLPKSFIKHIFNIEFLDKIDVELANCYFKDIYPHRVRKVLMELNRAVCLEYPEYNVPWFHQKYIEEYRKINALDDVATHFQKSVKPYLVGVLRRETILENVVTPYGYYIDFVLHLDKNKEPISDFDNLHTTKIALLLKNQSAFTRQYVRLRGSHSLKNRHLEILGYKIKMIKHSEWFSLLYAMERVEFIKELVFS